ncbi:MAG: hypothetical protein QW112_01050 [Candidatus Micrarchaeia archaeon]
MIDLLAHTLKVYLKNLGMVLFFSIPFIIAFILSFISAMPTYSALGAYFLRSGSMPQMTLAETAVIIAASIASLYLLSLALVAINIVVKSMKARTKISTEVVRNLGKYTFTVFSLFLAMKIIETGILICTVSAGMSELPVYIFSFIASLGLIFAAPAVVLEEKKPVPAIISSYRHILRKPVHFIAWLVLAFALVSAVMFVLYAMLDLFAVSRFVIQLLVVLINSLIILPLLIIFSAEIYLTKYKVL